MLFSPYGVGCMTAIIMVSMQGVAAPVSSSNFSTLLLIKPAACCKHQPLVVLSPSKLLSDYIVAQTGRVALQEEGRSCSPADLCRDFTNGQT